jgi:hypothetical protein
MITIFCYFCKSLAKIIGVYLKNQCYHHIFAKTSIRLSQTTAIYFARCFGENNLKIITSVPGCSRAAARAAATRRSSGRSCRPSGVRRRTAAADSSFRRSRSIRNPFGFARLPRSTPRSKPKIYARVSFEVKGPFFCKQQVSDSSPRSSVPETDAVAASKFQIVEIRNLRWIKKRRVYVGSLFY